MSINSAADFDPVTGVGTSTYFDGPFFPNRASVSYYYLNATAITVSPNKADTVNGTVQLC